MGSKGAVGGLAVSVGGGGSTRGFAAKVWSSTPPAVPAISFPIIDVAGGSTNVSSGVNVRRGEVNIRETENDSLAGFVVVRFSLATRLGSGRRSGAGATAALR